MPPRIIAVLARLRQDIAAGLSREAIEEACRRAGHRWRTRLLDPATTIYLFLLQVLHGNTACRHVVHFGRWAFTDSAYGQARKRLPLAVFGRVAGTKSSCPGLPSQPRGTLEDSLCPGHPPGRLGLESSLGSRGGQRRRNPETTRTPQAI